MHQTKNWFRKTYLVNNDLTGDGELGLVVISGTHIAGSILGIPLIIGIVAIRVTSHFLVVRLVLSLTRPNCK